jgi:integrase
LGRKSRKRVRGSGSVYRRGSGPWRIKYTVNGTYQYASGFPDRESAELLLKKILFDMSRGRAGIAPDPKSIPTLGALAVDWLERRAKTHRSQRDDFSRWKHHLGPFFGHRRPAELTAAEIRRFAEAKLLGGLSSTTVGHCIRLLSTFYSDLVERQLAQTNPVKALPRATRRLYRNAHDPRTTPFLERTEDIRRVFLALPQRYGVAFALGALGGLRPGEVLGLDWRDVDLAAGRMLVHQQVHRGELGPVKDDDSRVVPILPPLAPVLSEWRLATGGIGLLFAPAIAKRGGRPGSPPRFVRDHTLRSQLQKALKACGLPETMTVYETTRHTFAAQWVLGGGSIQSLREILGHASVTTTERYAHLRQDLFRESDLRAVSVDLSRPGGRVVQLAAHRDERCSKGADAQEVSEAAEPSIENQSRGPVAQVDRAAVS